MWNKQVTLTHCLMLLCKTNVVTENKRTTLVKSVEGYVGVHVGLQESDFSLRVTFIQRYLQERTQVRVRRNLNRSSRPMD